MLMSMDQNFEQLLLFMAVIEGAVGKILISVNFQPFGIKMFSNQANRGVEIVPEMEIIIDKKIKEVSDIENIFKLKLMDKVNEQATFCSSTSRREHFLSERSKLFMIWQQHQQMNISKKILYPRFETCQVWIQN